MYRVLIVDDEEPVLDSFSYMIKEYSSDFVLAGKARNGFEALSAIHDLQPDVVFMDINIPGMDGLKVIDTVHSQYPHMIFVLSTAYERFDLAQKAIPLGVHAYLVKPISKKMFIGTLEEIKNKLDKNRLARNVNENRRSMDTFFAQLMKGGFEEDDIENIKENLGITYNHGRIFIIEIEENNQKILQEIALRLSMKYFCLFDMNGVRGLFFIAGSIDKDELHKRLFEIIKQCLQIDIDVAIGIGIEKELNDLYESYESALSELINNKTNEKKLFRERMLIVQIRKKIGFIPKSEVIKLYETYLDELFENNQLQIAKCKLIILFALLYDDLSNYYKDTEPVEYLFPLEQEIMNSKSKEECNSRGRSIFSRLYDLFAEKRNQAMPIPLLKAIHYMQDHYSEPIQLSTVADAVFISPAYLSRIFTEYLSTTFIDYLTDLRISEAQKLIKNTNMSIKEIASKVGYSDPNYFGKCFKKITGYTPTDYLERSQNDTGVYHYEK
ncbi:response regulator transcription factor [Gracilinema caldarium]|uniref:Two component transcriptional regulator, AraC family n=1 Tax=Gracilinema caldarium (strain ATCC 51460 / DSM 7334 / H1) TaxID=744872 RepID=F8EWP2_GRAC1|nr:helix-turn-helix domain-containing protein [Gracilinema caldarium]AEJ18205.1 two component transcriptional regulator, AraC family [Gracilinema caldarium DSM 7334]